MRNSPFAPRKRAKHVLCEKPLAATAEQSARMVEACRQNGVLLMTAYRKYFEPSTVYLKSLISQRRTRPYRHDSHVLQRDLQSKNCSRLAAGRRAGGWRPADGSRRLLREHQPLARRRRSRSKPSRTPGATTHGDSKMWRKASRFASDFPSGLVVQGSSTYSAAISSFIFVQGPKGWLSLSPAYHLSTTNGASREKSQDAPIDRRFKVLDEFALEIDAFSSAILKKKPD